MGPIDYTIDVQQPFQAALQGYQTGLGLRQVQDQRAQAEQQKAAQLQMQKDLASLTSNPNAGPREYAAMTVKYPQLREQFKQASEMLNSEQQRGRLDLMTQGYSAILSGRPELAEQLMRDRATAMRNSGAPEQDIKAQEMWADMIKASPEQARHIGGLMLSSVMGPDKFADTFGKLGSETRADQLQPGLVRKGTADAAAAEADATTKAVTAKYAESTALKDLETKGWNIEALKADIDFKKQSARIAAMNAAIAKANSETARAELVLKRDDALRKRDEAIREKVGTAESGAANIDNMLNTIERIKGNKSLDDVVGAIEGRMPVIFGDENADAVALIETLGSQAFLAQIPSIKGMGALSNAEGDKLQAALQNLSRKQSEGQFRRNLDEAARLLKKGRETLAKTSGVPLGKPDTPAAPGARPPLDSFDSGR